ncbi:L-lactate dehydrogenase [Youngiibacter multivorans]|uniref:L-lactate dehydrogenase n=1 Tax=Youngiibacter multivorans TaxID=937251 RepID=A0ABS4G147_9CLOT|nr:L-lactate dehydrogenase [Youngiibacter multivorans]MBP1918227.1 L-lactate dehydrogenase [Youngiibacter multivorans]
MKSGGKIVILGAGHVGSHCGMALAWRGICREIVLVDKNEKKAAAQAMDISDALTFPPNGAAVRPGTYADCADADIVVIAIGVPRLPGQTRLDLLESSVRMLKELTETLKPIGIGGVVVTITNPADIAAYYVRRELGLPREKVFGTGTLLDTARLVRTISEKSGVSRGAISAFSMGEHGDSSMIPFSQVRIGALPFDSYPKLDKEYILERTRMTGMDIINGKDSTEFGIGQALTALCASIIGDERQVFPLSVLLEGEYGQRDVNCGVPCVVGRNGIESIVELPLNSEEQAQFDASCDIIRRHIEKACN